MTIHVEIKEGSHLIKIDGEMNIYTAPGLKQQLLDQLSQAQQLELDLSGVGEMDTAGLQILYLTKREALKKEKPLRLIAVSAAVKDVIQAYRMATYFEDPETTSRAHYSGDASQTFTGSNA